ncbi:hypothetical protein ACOSQ3_023366 [Xanthoceras sorbifolium]
MENSQTSSTTPTASASASGEPVIVSISVNTTAQEWWKLCIMTNLLFGYGLLGFVDGTRPCPLQTNPRYIVWTREDRLVLLGIQATVNSTISPTINNCTTSADAWN